MNYLRKTLNQFWKRWQTEYLLQLRDCHRLYTKSDKRGDPLHEVQIVLMHSDKCLRGFWKHAKVEKLIQGSDGHVRGAVIRLPTKGNRTTLLRRPLNCLYPLEVDRVTHDEKEKADVAKDTEGDGTPAVDKESLADAQNDLNKTRPI